MPSTPIDTYGRQIQRELQARDATEHTQHELDMQVAPWSAGRDGGRPDLNPEFIADIEKRLGLKFVPEGTVAHGTGVPPVKGHAMKDHGQDAYATSA